MAPLVDGKFMSAFVRPKKPNSSCGSPSCYEDQFVTASLQSYASWRGKGIEICQHILPEDSLFLIDFLPFGFFLPWRWA
jgi:hypothetical protein